MLYTLVYKDTQAEHEYEIGIDPYNVRAVQLQRAAAELKLNEPGSRGVLGLVLRPSDALKDLIAKHQDNPAIQAFLESAGIHDEDSAEVTREEAVRIVKTFCNRRGREGLEALLEELRAALGEK